MFDKSRVFAVGVPGEDELKLLLTRYRLAEPRLKIDDTDRAARELNYLLREGYEQKCLEDGGVRPVTLWDIDQRMKAWLSESEGEKVLDEKALCGLSPFTAKLEPDPRKKLSETKGWEPAAKEILGKLSTFKALHPEYDRAKAELSAKGESPLLTSRFTGSAEGIYPTADKLCHIMLTGPPGVGKTTLARLLGRIFADEGLLESGHVTVVKAADLISEHIGGTYHSTERALSRAEGGVLFIDEAYELYEGKPKDGRARSSYRNEALTVLVQALTDNHRHFLMVLAGYSCSAPDAKDGVEALFDMNPGLESRIKSKIKLESYSPELLEEIFENEIRRSGFVTGGGINKKGLVKICERIKRTSTETFANARTILNYAADVMSNSVERCPKAAGGERELLPEDFPEEVRELLGGRDINYEELLDDIRHELPGLGSIAADIVDRAYRRQRGRSARLGDSDANGIYSMIFAGRPGSGKTTAAKLLARAFGEMGLTGRTPPVIVDDPSNCHPDVFRQKIREALDKNTILLIDEAYGLRDELVTMLLSPMTESGLICIFCMYETEIEAFKNKNSGIASRLDIYHLRDYTPQEQTDIFRKMASDEG